VAFAFTALDFNPLAIRELPGRDPLYFFLWPPKQGYYGAADYGRAALEVVPARGHVLASHTPYQTLRYFQVVEGLRPDVNAVKVEPDDDLGRLVQTMPEGAAVFLADNDRRYYDLDSIARFRLEPAGVLYRLILPPPAPDAGRGEAIAFRASGQ
jgi:hypothetical protein